MRLEHSLGQLAALATSVLFAATSTFFTLAGRRVGSFNLNRLRLLGAIGYLLAAHALFRLPLPWNAEPDRLFWLGLSGLIGLVLGDIFLYQAFVVMGPRLSMLMMSLAPAIATIVAWIYPGEQLTLPQLAGIALTLSGIAWVVSDTRGSNGVKLARGASLMQGVLFGLGAATGQAGGLVTAKLGAYGDFPALSGALIRMVTAALIMWGFAFIRGQAGKTIQTVKENPIAIWLILGGAFTGPFLGVTLSLFAVQNAQVGIASTLMALPPVILLPVGYFVFQERFGWKAVAGTVVAMAGVALLFLV
jgi:drug/metabolite transporter (DMT)-like permease